MSDSNPVFFNNELLEVMRENLESSFTDTVNQTKALKSHILSKLELSQNEIKDCDQDLNEKIRKFASNAINKYLKNSRTFSRFKDIKKIKFEIPKSIMAKLKSKGKKTTPEVPSKCYEDTIQKAKQFVRENSKHAEQTSSIEKSKTSATRTLKPFEEKSKRAQYSEAKKVRDSFESPAIVLAAAQSLSQAGNKDASFEKKGCIKNWPDGCKSKSCNYYPIRGQQSQDFT